MRTGTFRISINTENAAFDGEESGAELARILRGYASVIDGATVTPDRWEDIDILRDVNGNKVGTAGFVKVNAEPAPPMR